MNGACRPLSVKLFRCADEGPAASPMPVIAFGACTGLPTLAKWALHQLCESPFNKDADLVTAGRAHARACASAVAPALALALAPALLLLLCFPLSA